jgi:hypothetical protein
MYRRFISVAIIALGQMGCSDTSEKAEDTSDSFTGIQLSLSMEGQVGTSYRLSPATFSIRKEGTNEPPRLIEASADVNVVTTPVDPGQYTVSLQTGWVLNRVREDGSITPIPATLYSPNEQSVWVNDRTEPVIFGFRLGQSSIAVGATVDDEYFHSQSDGTISLNSSGKYQIWLYGTGGGPICCFETVEEARTAFPGLNLTTSE